MVPDLLAQWMKERRSPYLLLTFIGLSVLAVVLFGMSSEGKTKIDVFLAEGTSEAEAAGWIERLNKSEAFEFVLRDEEPARAEVREGRAMAAVQLLPDDYRIVAAVDEIQGLLAERHVDTVFRQELQLRAAAERSGDPERFRLDAERILQNPPLTLHAAAPDGGEIVSYDMGLQLMFGFALFLAMFTIGSKINAVNAEKTSGIWNRMILSPVRKTQMYLGHLTYGFAAGFLQLAIVYLIFLYGFGFDLGGRFGMLLIVSALYTVAAVALAMLIAGMTKTPVQFNMVYPSVVPIFPLISGAYMPPGTITNDVLLVIGEFVPLTHAMDALLGIALYDAGWGDIFLPLAKLLLFAVICMGVGINLVERGRR
ncbi:ABC transporter permease [Paenibacillus arenilitoris]|uniref:ABC transporter permease n=1 Tax=Paenibacillus arenilitoris TaxID=2772299 RepID=A0A927H632_9BACL|nr:ABC transporter permease [Paenibacillus arenilitoris]MBD2869072.1 ABC transporter permease [Paenibacillus arenilitoris]